MPLYALKNTEGSILRVETFNESPPVLAAAKGLTWELHVEPPPAQVSIQRAHEIIDRFAGDARARYITVAPGQEGTYLEKRRQAQAFADAGYTGTPPAYIAAEAAATGSTATQAAQLILAQAAAWDVKGAEIEGCRRKWKIAVETTQDRNAAVQSAAAELAAL